MLDEEIGDEGSMGTLLENSPRVISQDIMAPEIKLLGESSLVSTDLITILLDLALPDQTPFKISQEEVQIFFFEIKNILNLFSLLLLNLRDCLGGCLILSLSLTLINCSLIYCALINCSLILVLILWLTLVLILGLSLVLDLGLFNNIDIDFIFFPEIEGGFDEFLDWEINMSKSLRFLLNLVEFLELNEGFVPFLLFPEDQKNKNSGLKECFSLFEEVEFLFGLVPEVLIGIFEFSLEIFVKEMVWLFLVNKICGLNRVGNWFLVTSDFIG